MRQAIFAIHRFDNASHGGLTLERRQVGIGTGDERHGLLGRSNALEHFRRLEDQRMETIDIGDINDGSARDMGGAKGVNEDLCFPEVPELGCRIRIVTRLAMR